MRISFATGLCGLTLLLPAAGRCAVTLLTDFDGNGTQAPGPIFRPPSWSGSTGFCLAGTPDISQPSTDLAFSPTHSLNVQWAFVDDSPFNWLRLTTNGYNPVIDARGAVTMKVFLASPDPLEVCLGVRERTYASDPPLGSFGNGTTGPIEWIGASGVVNGVPNCTHTITPGSWQQLTFNLPTEPVTAFTGNGVLNPTFGKVDMEHLAFVSPSQSTNPVSLYIDDINIVSSSGASVSVGTTLSAAPAVADGVIYAGGDNGKLYAFQDMNLSPVSGYPVDISQAVGTPVKLNTPPAVYYGNAGRAIYLTTNLGHVVKLWPDGKVAWVSKPLSGPARSTPAVTPAGNVYVDLGAGSASVMNFEFKLDETTGHPLYISPYLGSSTSAPSIDRSAAVDSRYCYLNASTSNLGSLAVLNQENLVVRASFAPGEDALAPFIAGKDVYVATNQGSVYKVNGITMSPDLSFGKQGASKIGEHITAGPFLSNGVVYVGSATGRVWQVDAGTGGKSLFLDSGANAPVTGLLVVEGLLVFTTGGSSFQQAPVTGYADSQITALGAPPAGGPVYDPSLVRFVIATTSGKLYSIPRL